MAALLKRQNDISYICVPLLQIEEGIQIAYVSLNTLASNNVIELLR